MSNTVRHVLTAVVAISLAAFCFLSGYLVRDMSDGDAPTENDLSLFHEAWSKIEAQFIGEIPADNTQLNYTIIRGALNELNDPYTIFLEPKVREEEKEDLRGQFGGIGVTLRRLDSGEIEIEPIPDNPAANAGIRSGDILLAIDGTPLDDTLSTDEIAEQLKGETETTVTVTVRHIDNETEEEIAIERRDILIPSVTSRILRDAPSIGYIKLSRFSGESGDEIRDAIESLQAQNATQYILDLRGNGGGLLDAAVSVSDHFLDDKIVYFHNSRSEGERIERTDGDTLLPDEPLVVLIDGGTASASEVVVGALHDHDRALLIGETTYGKGSVQLVYDLSDASSVHVTWARWQTPKRTQLDNTGIAPHIEVKPSAEAMENGRDEPLERAINYLQTGS